MFVHLDDKEDLFLLFDLYKNLLTENQNKVFESCIMYDVSLNEIAEQENISKQAVKDTLDKAKSNLLKYENALHLAEKFKTYVAVLKRKNSLAKEEYINILEGLLED